MIAVIIGGTKHGPSPSAASRKSSRSRRRVSALQTEVTETEEKLKRLYKMVEDGVTDFDDILKDRLAKLDRDRAKTASTGSGRKLPRRPRSIGPTRAELSN